jgi:hypothetical protein
MCLDSLLFCGFQFGLTFESLKELGACHFCPMVKLTWGSQLKGGLELPLIFPLFDLSRGWQGWSTSNFLGLGDFLHTWLWGFLGENVLLVLLSSLLLKGLSPCFPRVPVPIPLSLLLVVGGNDGLVEGCESSGPCYSFAPSWRNVCGCARGL